MLTLTSADHSWPLKSRIFLEYRAESWQFNKNTFKVSARVKKGEFSKFLISGRLDKVFQELSLKKIPQKNITSVQSYWTLRLTAR